MAITNALGSSPVKSKYNTPFSSNQYTQSPSNSSSISLSKYLSILAHQNVFGGSKKKVPITVANRKTNENLTILLQDYQIQGTILGDNPKLLILDKKSRVVLTLGVGELIGAITIEAIYRDHVTFILYEESIDVKF